MDDDLRDARSGELVEGLSHARRCELHVRDGDPAIRKTIAQPLGDPLHDRIGLVETTSMVHEQNGAHDPSLSASGALTQRRFPTPSRV